MKISQLCSMIQDSVRSGRYQLDNEIQKKCATALQVTNMSGSDDELDNANNIQIETRINDLFVLNNYVPSIRHLPGVIELDVLDSFKIICRRLERIEPGIQIGRD